MKYGLLFTLVLAFGRIHAQYEFSGQVDSERWQTTVYLSVIEDYRKLSGIYAEQFIAKTKADSSGFFKFNGNQLGDAHKLYRIHVDNCSSDSQNLNHFGGHCPDSNDIVFIAKNTDSINFPFSFDKQMFCDINSTNDKAMALVKIDSIKDEMRFAYSELRSEASRKLNNKKWFTTLQGYGKNLEEPLAELYIFSFLSDRSSEFHNYYLEDLKNNAYYGELKDRLSVAYPETSYSKQYQRDFESDQYAIKGDHSSLPWYYYVLIIIAAVSIFLNISYYLKKKKKRSNSSNLKSSLTKQEETILNHILDDKSNKDIAEVLFVSVSTVKTHINNIYKKLNVSSREEAISLFK